MLNKTKLIILKPHKTASAARLKNRCRIFLGFPQALFLRGSVKYKKEILGVSLLELLLVLVVAGLILIAGYRQYLIYRYDADVQQLKQNVDILMASMTLYYRANCGETGALSPTVALTDPMKIDINNDLIQNGYLSANAFPVSPLVNRKGGDLGGYRVQFNKLTMPRSVCTSATGTDSAGPLTTQGCASSTVIGTILIWKPQVAVSLANTALAQTQLQQLGGDCLSSPSSNTTVYPCSANQPGTFVVWERLPSNASTQMNTPFHQLMPTAQQFQQMYTTYPITYLTQSSGVGPYETQYFLCGG